MRMTHDCQLPPREIYWTVETVTVNWVCPECGEAWEINYKQRGVVTYRLWPRLRVIRHWKWRRRVKRAMKEEGYE